MIISDIFAPEYARNDRGWIKFPRDQKVRNSTFTKISYSHPAKANYYLVEELIKYTTQPGDWIMDVTAGTGTILIAVPMGRHVTMLELNSEYAQWIRDNASQMGISDYLLLEGDCRNLLPIPGHSAIIFSPPYSTTMKGGGGIHSREKSGEEYGRYQSLKGNLGDLTAFQYGIEMNKIYKKCWDSLVPGGTLSLIIKDFYEGDLQQISFKNLQFLVTLGFEIMKWEEWEAPGTQFKAIHKSQGHRIVEQENIIIVRKPADA
jgi:tRNA G10  N-methylase Trm11